MGKAFKQGKPHFSTGSNAKVTFPCDKVLLITYISYNLLILLLTDLSPAETKTGHLNIFIFIHLLHMVQMILINLK